MQVTINEFVYAYFEPCPKRRELNKKHSLRESIRCAIFKSVKILIVDVNVCRSTPQVYLNDRMRLGVLYGLRCNFFLHCYGSATDAVASPTFVYSINYFET